MTGLYDTAGHYVRSQRIAAGLSLEDLALGLETDPPVAARRRALWLGDIEHGGLEVTPTTAVALRAIKALRIDDYLLAVLMEQDARRQMAIRFRPAAAPVAAQAAGDAA